MKKGDSDQPFKGEEWVERQLRIHLKKKQLEAPLSEKIQLLKKRKRQRKWMLVLNIVAILFFGSSFYFGITQLSDTFLYVLFAVFIINMVLIFYQTKQLTQLITHLEHRQDRAG